MFDWLRRLFRSYETEMRLRFPESVDVLNAQAGGGDPVTRTAVLGNLPLPSGTLVLGDPQCFPDGDLEVPNINASQVAISASLWKYPSGMAQVKALKLSFAGPQAGMTRRKIGEVGIDSAKLAVADKADIAKLWTDVGKDRIGVIPGSDDTVLRMLNERFKLKTKRINPWRTEVIGPVSELLEKDIVDYLKSQPQYADYPVLYFHVQTNNSFDRANFLAEAWSFMPVGNTEAPLMFVCGTGRGDGVYEVECEFADKTPRVLSIRFIDE
jgi:hypothetical protein